MKAFIAGITTLTLLIGAITTNAVMITKKTDDILKIIDELPLSASDADARELCLLWEKTRPWIAVAVHRENVDDIDDTLSQLTAEISLQSDSGYLRQKTKLRDIVERLRKTESFSLSRIF